MSSNMLDSRASRAQLPSVLKPNPSIQTQNMEEISLRAGTAKLAQDNEEELLKLMREHTAVANYLSRPILSDDNSDADVGSSLSGHQSNDSVGRFLRVDSRVFSQSSQQNAYSTGSRSASGRSFSPLNLQEEARRAKEALGMTAPAKFPTSLCPEEKAKLVAMLPPIEVDVAIYNPFGTFIIPCHNLTVAHEMTLRDLINSIQDLVDKKTKPEDFKWGLLVSMIQVKMFNNGKFTKFPKIKGELRGNKVVYPSNDSVASPSSSQGGYHAIASVRARAVVDEKDIPCASTAKWLVGPGSEEESYWAEYRTALQLSVVMASPKAKPAFTFKNNNYGQKYKKSMIKVMTVTKVGLLSVFVGVHNFELVPETQDKEKVQEEGHSTDEMTDSLQDKGQRIEKAQPHDPFANSILGKPKSKQKPKYKKKVRSQANATIPDKGKGNADLDNHSIDSTGWQEQISNSIRVRPNNNTMGSTRGEGIDKAGLNDDAILDAMASRDKGKGKAGPHDKMVNTIQDRLQRNGLGQSMNIGDTDIEFALKFAQNLILEHNAQQAPQTQKARTAKVMWEMKANGRDPLRELTPKSSKETLPKGSGGVKVDWSYYQKMGGNPAMHKLINFDHVPFEPMSVNNWVKPDTAKAEEDLRRAKEAFNSQDTAPKMVPYQELDPLLVDMLITDQKIIKNAKTLEKKDAAVRFDEEDDNKFLYGKMSPVKLALAQLAVSPSSQFTQRSTHTFPEFDPSILTNDSPGLFAQQTNDSPLPRSNLNPDHTGPSIEDLFKKFSAGTAVPSHMYECVGMNTQHYTFSSTSVNTLHYNRSPSPQRSIPANQRPMATWVRSPSPGKNMNMNNFVPRSIGNMQHQQQSHNQEDGGANLFQSFSAFNNAAHEMQNQASGHGGDFYNMNTSPTKSHAQMSGGHYNMSPTKTHAQMHRAFNATSVVNFTPGHQSSSSQNYQNQQGRLSGWPTTPYNQNSGRNDSSSVGAFNYQLPSQSQGVLSSQIPSIETPGPGTQAFYSPSGQLISSSTPNIMPTHTSLSALSNTAAQQATFNIGAGTSRGWNGSGAIATPRNARPTGGYVRRTAQQSSLRADSPSFTSSGGLGGGLMGLGGSGGRGRAVSGGLMGEAYRNAIGRGGNGVDESEE
ncbi:uncharacterized protein PAC_11848 [Phialocephala subalpina]|uniref:Uncharacterized protein n=1 Tax=Phialocephala subalpina TaxID=576137 RepID=A0A1L7XA99_9HELO|nr:uncharacterized protein PAC_11848 [Phialocephala subalpina]